MDPIKRLRRSHKGSNRYSGLSSDLGTNRAAATDSLTVAIASDSAYRPRHGRGRSGG
jgi:hypothetical protein